MEDSVAKGLRDFCNLPRDSLAGRTSSGKKHLDKFFKNFVLSVLATGPGDLLATWLSHEHRVFCANRSVFEPFSVFPRIFLTVHCLPHFKPLSNSPCHSRRTSIFASFHSKIFNKKVWVLSLTLHLSHLLHMSFRLCVSTAICISLDCLWVFVFLVKSWCDFWCLYIDLLYIELIFSH